MSCQRCLEYVREMFHFVVLDRDIEVDIIDYISNYLLYKERQHVNFSSNKKLVRGLRICWRNFTNKYLLKVLPSWRLHGTKPQLRTGGKHCMVLRAIVNRHGVFRQLLFLFFVRRCSLPYGGFFCVCLSRKI